MSPRLHPSAPPAAPAPHGLEGELGRARREFLERVDGNLREARGCGQRLAVFLVGVDRRRGLHATLEGEAGPSLRTRASERLAGCVEEGAFAARLHEDTFGLVKPRLRNGLQARETAIRILGSLGSPYRTSIGIAVFPGDGLRASELLCCAAWALSHARRARRPTYCFYFRAFATSAASSSPLL